MKKLFLLFISIVVYGYLSIAQVAINADGLEADPSAMLDVKSIEAGVLVPRMTAGQRDGIISAATGLMVYVTTDNSFYFYNGSAWERVNSLKGEDTSDPIPIIFQGSVIYVHPTDNSTGIIWGSTGISSGTTSNTDGEANTATLVASGGATAAVLCNDLTAYGHSDWYLPARYELDAIYKQSYLMANLEQISTYKYWSSTESDTDQAWSQRLDYGGPDPVTKDIAIIRVRCVRKD